MGFNSGFKGLIVIAEQIYKFLL